MALPVKTQEILRTLAVEEGIPDSEIDKIVSSQFRLVHDVMKEGKFEAVRLPYFGKFHAKPERIAHIQEASRKASRSR